MSCNCCDDGTEAIHVYVELCGNESYHSSLRGRDEENQHPISAITNLETTLETINTTLEDHSNLIEEHYTEVTDRLETLSSSLLDVNSEITDINNKFDNYYTSQQIDAKIETVMRYKGSVTTFNDLPQQNEIGDVYNVLENGANYVWTGIGWDNLSPYLDLEKYATKDYVDGAQETTVNLIKEYLILRYYNKQEIDEMFEELDPSTQNCFVYRGAVATFESLPATAPVGNTYTVLSNNVKYFYDGFNWEPFDSLIDVVYTKDEVNNLLNYKADKDQVEDDVSRLQGQLDVVHEKLLDVETHQKWQVIQDVIGNN